MKKVFGFLMVLALLFSVAACSNSTTNDEASSPTQQSSTTNSASNEESNNQNDSSAPNETGSKSFAAGRFLDPPIMAWKAWKNGILSCVLKKSRK